MIRRITKNNDLKDLIKSCPTGVIDDIYSIRYYIEGNPDVEIEPTFSKVNNHLEVVIPSSMLENLGNGILMRRSLYKASDPEYPDGYYNLEFIDDLNVWLGEEEVSPFVPSGEYLTASDLKTVNNQSIVGNGNINIEASVPDYYATKSWVSSQQFATQSWVQSQGYITSTGVSGLATMSWVLDQGYITSTGVSGLATMSWVEAQGYITSETLPEDIATQSWVSSNFLSTTALTGYATESWVSSNYVSTTTLSNYTTFSDIDSYISSFWYRAAEEFYSQYVPRSQVGSYLSGYATQSWVQSQGYLTSHQDLSSYATQSWVESQSYITSVALSGYATESWVQSQGYLTSHQDLSSYATKSWVESQSYITSVALSGYATESWVESQGYLTSHQDLSSYATKSWVSESLSSYATQSWVSTNYLPQSVVWTGTQSQWDQLTAAEKATYIIALVTE